MSPPMELTVNSIFEFDILKNCPFFALLPETFLSFLALLIPASGISASFVSFNSDDMLSSDCTEDLTGEFSIVHCCQIIKMTRPYAA